MTGYRIAWEAGPSAQLELFSPQPGTNVFRMKFSPPMRKTLRPPIEELVLGPAELGPINRRIANLVGVAHGGRGTGGGGNAPDVIKSAKETGRLLQWQMMPTRVQTEFAGQELFVELGLDEALLEYPWELMHDGQHFFGCKHAVGRFVNVSQAHIPPGLRPAPLPEDALRVLMISVPNPQPRDQNTIFKPLKGAEKETEAVIKILTAAGAQVKPLVDREATWDNVMALLNDETQRFHIIHYNGHATFNAQNPRQSALILHDQNLTTGQILMAFETRPPVLFFVNGCETAKTKAGPTEQGGKLWQDTFDIFGLARAFLDTGAYLIGTRWEVGDDAAALFAKTFYTGLLEEKPLGTLVRDARLACYEEADRSKTNDFSWASYAFYGDPRLYFSKIMPAAASPPPAPAAAVDPPAAGG
jgi:CHAT domain-containing protein